VSTPLIILLSVLGIAWIWDELRSAPTIEEKEKPSKGKETK